MLRYQLEHLDNGIPVYLIPMEHVGSTVQVCLVGGGSLYETKKTSGLSHFLEHMLFKGTAKRPSARDISFEIESMGGRSNAFTGQEYIGFHIKAPGRFFGRVADILSDQVLYSLLDEEEIEREKGAVVQEIRMRFSNPQGHVFDLLPPLVWGDQAAGRLIAGTEKNVKAFTREQICRYVANFFTSSNMLLVCAGNTPPAREVLSVLNGAWGAVLGGARPKKFLLGKMHPKTEPAIKIEHRDNPDTWVAMMFRAPAYTNDDFPALAVLNTILGSGTSSRLFLEVRERRGLAYSVGSYIDKRSQEGGLGLYMGVDPERLQEALRATKDVLQGVAQLHINESELVRACNLIESGMNDSSEDAGGAAMFIAQEFMLRGSVSSHEEYLHRIMQVSAEDVRTLAERIFVSGNMSVALVGPHGGQEELVLQHVRL